MRWLPILAVLWLTPVAGATPPPTTGFHDGAYEAWTRGENLFEECSALARARGAHGWALVQLRITRADYVIRRRVTYSARVSARERACVRRQLGVLLKEVRFDYVSDLGEVEHFQVELGDPRPLLPEAAALLPAWQANDRRALARLVAAYPDLRLTRVGAVPCIMAPGAHAAERAAGEWERTVPGAVARLWTDPNARRLLFDDLLPAQGSRQAYWLGDHVLLSDYLGTWGYDYNGGDHGYRFCLVPVTDAWRRAALAATEAASDCWLDADLATRLTRPRTCRADFPGAYLAGALYGGGHSPGSQPP